MTVTGPIPSSGFAREDPDAVAYAKKFSEKYAHRVITGGVGHNLPQEAPKAFAEAVVEFAGY